MITNLEIKNFKSIKHLKLDCKRVNVFIGEPNSGKSNILESLALQSQNAISGAFLSKDIFRYKTLGNLFYDSNINNPIEVKTDEKVAVLEYATRVNGTIDNRFNFFLDKEKDKDNYIIIAHDGKIERNPANGNTNVHYYKFKNLEKFQESWMPHLSVPFGENIPTLLLSNTELKKWVSSLFRSFGFKLMLKPTEGDMSMAKEVNDELYEYPYFTISETLQRLIFYSIAIKSNQNSVLIFDEPDSNMFPFYIKEFAERIADNETNQFFISTHNPYFLGSVLEKTAIEDIAVFINTMKQS